MERDLDASSLQSRLRELLDGGKAEDADSSEDKEVEVAKTEKPSSKSGGEKDDKIA